MRKEFNQQEYFPEIIIPFYITPQEARSQLDKWLAANKDTKEAQIISQHCKQLAAYYLPYQVVQGSVDCCFLEDGKWVLLDYKTDRADDPDALREHYRKQLNVYALALERITGVPVAERYLCLLSKGLALEV